MVVKEGHERVKELIDWGARFDKEEGGEYNLGMEGGHSEYRILHYKDVTGWEIQRTLNVRNRKTCSYLDLCLGLMCYLRQLLQGVG